MITAPEGVLKDYRQGARDALEWKLDGLAERDLREPRTGTNLLGIAEHALNVEVVYSVRCDDPNPQVDRYATETREH
ncbi:DinB family protein [Nocardioides sp. LMS-CY]|uniref:mycothiol transferase n=1 Tax=Nocardioides sp. (strain LMS-CY) TaxID=2840457 RepID=UPI001C0021B7|nr:DUF664 domain-containing protein [Nocardioides sp. LMS-CY]QWF22144.1 DinB family protein [Nocardioides sp. LMS-CY]